jgi:predicted DNA-binding antitoxin AbrB/MazE fold protein
MTRTIQAVFDGEVLRPQEPLDLKPETRVQITIQSLPDQENNGTRSFLDLAASLNLEGPSDWSENLEQYLYGTRGHADE